MNDKQFLTRLETSNFRCLPEESIGPFTSFNLIYGRNGSGKSSLLEALELVLTGSSYRFGTNDNVREVLARNKKKEVIVKAMGVSNHIAIFKDGKLSPAAKTLLQLLYGITTHGQKARFLLRQFFSTHNILYAERVARFLEAEEKGQLNSALKELTLGRDILENWSYFEEAKKSIHSIFGDLSSQRDHFESEINEIQKSLQEVAIEDKNKISSLANELKTSLPILLKNEFMKNEFNLNHDWEKIIRELGTILREAEDNANKLRVFFQVHESPETWKAFFYKVDQFLKAKNESENEINAIIQNLEKNDEDLDVYKGNEREISWQLAEAKAEEEQMAKAMQKIFLILDWLPELNAEENSKLVEQEIRGKKDILAVLRSALHILRDLSSSEQIRKLDLEIKELEIEQIKIAKNLEEIQHKRNTIEEELLEIEKRLMSKQKDHGRLANLITQIHEQVKEFIKLQSDSRCPTCGHYWVSVEELERAMYEHYELLRKELNLKVEEISGDTAKKIKLQGELASLDKLNHEENARLGHCSDRLKGARIEENEIQAKADELFALLKKIDFIDEETKSMGLEHRISRLDSQLLSLRANNEEKVLAQAEANYSQIWSSLRKYDFEKKKPELMVEKHLLEELLGKSNLSLPKRWEFNVWNELLEKVKNKKSTLTQMSQNKEIELAGIEQHKATLIEKRKTLEQKRTEAHDSREKAEEQLEKWKMAGTWVDFLRHYEFIEVLEAINTEKVYDRIRQLRRQAVSLYEGLNYQLKAQTMQSTLGRNLEIKQKELKKCVERLQIAINLKRRFEEILPVTNIQKSVWDEYGEIISLIFKKLHWPPDFNRVRLNVKANELDLEVESHRIPDNWFPGHNRLSSGQRSALAVSVFWAFNVLPNTLPPFLIMDEPIQNVDELNVLNFLDGLRWLAEGVNKQVFLTTANLRIAGLIRRKFSYLGDGFLELRLKREGNASVSAIEYWDAQGKMIKSNKMSAALS